MRSATVILLCVFAVALIPNASGDVDMSKIKDMITSKMADLGKDSKMAPADKMKSMMAFLQSKAKGSSGEAQTAFKAAMAQVQSAMSDKGDKGAMFNKLKTTIGSMGAKAKAAGKAIMNKMKSGTSS